MFSGIQISYFAFVAACGTCRGKAPPSADADRSPLKSPTGAFIAAQTRAAPNAFSPEGPKPADAVKSLLLLAFTAPCVKKQNRLNAYYDAKIFENDPFAKLDQVGVGKLMDMAIKLGKPVNPNLHIGICGEHGGDPSSVEFCNKIGLDYVSCSPFRVPVARLAAAQAAIAQKNK